MTRAAMAGDIAGSRFERSLWEGRTIRDARCVGFDAEPRFDCRGESATTFELFNPACHITDDSILTIAVMDWLLIGGDPRVALRSRFRGCSRPDFFGKYFRAWAAADDDTPCGSLGNGAAMRMAPVGYAVGSLDEVLRLAEENARATHATPDAVAGAQAFALGVYLARTGTPRATIAKEIQQRFGYDLARSLDDWRQGYRFTSACDKTVPVAFRAFLESSTHEEGIRAAISVGGDSDTIACMAGALAGAYWGIPRASADQVAAALVPDLLGALLAFESRYPESLKIAAS